ncbi:hypothetical protein OG884_28385 [Streptosporangium sp. NBC_01755]|uniref:DUF6879 family protein n=1 Tax=unclassified Streptosporangium TaxID=2632669 RepID=UPI002DDB44B7|nr:MULTISPECIES: DUF6879 family protein [unclassified Streptosporangium]WSA23103.1 hypothetical protein OIE13_19200 [Streptosporangium sp. NBC_01810]WSC98754.1 hypothetical protein OG884_28385 [Streptosporangium sp. NBC_01755]
MKIYPPAESTGLSTTDGHVDDFGRFFNELRSRWVKVERLQEYDESDFEGYQAFKNGDFATARKLVQEMVRGQEEIYTLARQRDISMVRIRICDLPLSSYLVNYEIPAYLADIECGEDIRFINSRDIQQLLSDSGISDYVLYDDTRVVALIYDEATARVREARLVDSPALVTRYAELSDELIERSVPMLESPIYRSVI